METAERILREFDTIAVVGISRDPDKSAHSVPQALQQAGFRIVPINPHADELLGEKVYRSLAEVPFPVPVVLVFRPSADAAAIATQAVTAGSKALWLQQGIESAQARDTAQKAGLLYVEDRCMAVERAVRQIVKTRRA